MAKTGRLLNDMQAGDQKHAFNYIITLAFTTVYFNSQNRDTSLLCNVWFLSPNPNVGEGLGTAECLCNVSNNNVTLTTRLTVQYYVNNHNIHIVLHMYAYAYIVAMQQDENL